MTVQIDTTAVINAVRMAQQNSHPASPASGYELLYVISGSANGGLFLKDSTGKQIGPFITGANATTATVSASRSAGDLTLNNNSGFIVLTTSIDLTISATTGDVVGINMAAILDVAATGNWTALDAATMVSASPVNYVSNGTATPETLGVPAWFCWDSANTLNGEWLYTVQSGDISGGNVTFRFYYKTGTANNRTLRAASGQQLKAWVKNYKH